MKNKKWYPVVYMFICTFILSSILIGFARYTSTRVEANKQIAFETAVLEVFNVELPSAKLDQHKFFVEQVQPLDEKDGAYKLVQDGVMIGYALPFEGQGFWAPIKGVIGISPDKVVITGIAIYEQNETPGLGAEIAKPEFLSQFDIKNERVIASSGDAFMIKPVGLELKSNEVYAVTGATQTCTRLEKIINEALVEWRKIMVNK